MANDNIFDSEKVAKIIDEFNKTGYLTRENPIFMRDIRKRKGYLHFQ